MAAVAWDLRPLLEWQLQMVRDEPSQKKSKTISYYVSIKGTLFSSIGVHYSWATVTEAESWKLFLVLFNKTKTISKQEK